MSKQCTGITELALELPVPNMSPVPPVRYGDTWNQNDMERFVVPWPCNNAAPGEKEDLLRPK
jgi:hypothetical protein